LQRFQAIFGKDHGHKKMQETIFNIPESKLIDNKNFNKIYPFLANNNFLISAANSRM
jgi:hypothetical protein